MSATPAKSVYVVKPREESGIVAKPRLVRGARRSSVENYVVGAFSIEKATFDECVDFGAQGVVIEDSGE